VTYDEYLAYLRSPWWTARKAAVRKYRGDHCERCHCRYRLELHHRTYKRLGRELPEDVELLCWACHRREHGYQRAERWADLERMRIGARS
jgi:5-methylcytosine-specific restriction endonuclease McrA